MDKILAPIIELASIIVCLAFPDRKESSLIIFLMIVDGTGSLVSTQGTHVKLFLVANF